MPNIPDQPSAGDDIRNRVARLEREVVRLREDYAVARSDAGAARVLAAGADHDVAEVRAELRAHTTALNALRETQLEMWQDVAGLKTDVGDLKGDVRDLKTDVGGLKGDVRGLKGDVGDLKGDVAELSERMTAGFSTLGVGMAQITALLTDLHDER